MSILSKIKSLFIKEAKADEISAKEIKQEEFQLQEQNQQEEQKEQEKPTDQNKTQENTEKDEITYTLNDKQFEELREKVFVKVETRILELLNQNIIQLTEQQRSLINLDMWKKVIKMMYNNRNKIAEGIVWALTMLAVIFGVNSCLKQL